MVAGHLGLAAAVKSTERQIPLWILMLATVWLDVVFVPLLIAGVERIDTSLGGGYGESVIYADYTHSLVGAATLAALFGAVAGWRWGRRAGSVLGAVVFSHWLLDLVVHRADMPILPGNLGDLPRLGFGLWQVPAASAGGMTRRVPSSSSYRCSSSAAARIATSSRVRARPGRLTASLGLGCTEVIGNRFLS